VISLALAIQKFSPHNTSQHTIRFKHPCKQYANSKHIFLNTLFIYIFLDFLHPLKECYETKSLIGLLSTVAVVVGMWACGDSSSTEPDDTASSSSSSEEKSISSESSTKDEKSESSSSIEISSSSTESSSSSETANSSDKKRVYATCFSMGGGMAHQVACSMSDVFAAVATAGMDLNKTNSAKCETERPIPVIMFRGTGDPVCRYQGGDSGSLHQQGHSKQRGRNQWSQSRRCHHRLAIPEAIHAALKDSSRIVKRQVH